MSNALFLSGATLLAFLASGCVQYDHIYHAPRVQHGAASPGHGYADHYFFDEHFYRYDHGHWQRAARIHGPWHAAVVHEVPRRVQGSHAQRRSGKAKRHASRPVGAPPAAVRVQPKASRGRKERAIAPARSAARAGRRDSAHERSEVRASPHRGRSEPRRVGSERRGTPNERLDTRPGRREIARKQDPAALQPGKPRRATRRGRREALAPEVQPADRRPRRR